jgi:hypothetical protein
MLRGEHRLRAMLANRLLVEAEAAFTEAHPFAVTDDEVIE